MDGLMTAFDCKQYSSRIETKPLPRLTRYLRSFTRLEPRKDLIDNASVKPLERHNKFSWPDLKKIIEGHSCMSPQVSSDLSHLQELAKTICGGEQKLVDETAIFIFRLFMDKKKALNKHCTLIKQLYGNVSFTTVNQICSVVNQVIDELTDECIDKIKQGFENKSDDDRQNEKSLWGGHIIFNPPTKWIPPDTSFLTDLNQQKNIIENFSMVYNKPVEKEEVSGDKGLYNKNWMIKEVQKCFPAGNPIGVSSEEFCDSIIEMLNCSKSTDELQNDLFDFLGYDNFELTLMLLEHRKDIVMICKLENEKKMVLKPLNSNERKREGYLSQVTVKSQEEKLLEKIARKEEKKLSKHAAMKESQIEDEKFDPLELRNKRIAALSNQNTWATQEKKKPEPKETFPHVYDSMRMAQSQTGWCSDSSEQKFNIKYMK